MLGNRGAADGGYCVGGIENALKHSRLKVVARTVELMAAPTPQESGTRGGKVNRSGDASSCKPRRRARRLAPLYSLASPAKTRATRKPRPLFPPPGQRLKRYAQRQPLAPLNQLPPRNTREEPDDGPSGSLGGEFS